MKITHNMLADSTLRNINKILSRLDRLQNQLSTGQRISAPSDDPLSASAAVSYRAALGEIEQYIENVDTARSWLEATDSALGSITQVLQRARELAVQGASDALSLSDRQRIAAEVTELIDHTIAQANSGYAGQFLFSGFKVSTRPFTLASGPPDTVVYNGDNGQIRRQIESGSAIVVNVVGGSALSPVFSALIAVRDALNAGDAQAVSATLANIDGAIDSVLTTRSEVGAKINRLSGQAERLEDLKVSITGLLSKIQDVDMAEAITDFTMQQNVYQAALTAGAKAIQPSLLDYLR